MPAEKNETMVKAAMSDRATREPPWLDDLGALPGRHETTSFTQFLAVCSSSILAETPGYVVSLSSPRRAKRRVFEQCKPVFMDQLQPSTNSGKLSEMVLEGAFGGGHSTRQVSGRLLRACPSGYGAGGSERGEAGGPCLGPWALVEPGHDPVHIDGGGDGHVLEVCFLAPPLSGVP